MRTDLLSAVDTEQTSWKHKATNQACKCTAHLANHLPTGSVLAFQILSPIFTKQGNCDAFNKIITAVLVALCGASCFLMCFTDSFKDKKGNVRYGVPTLKGLWVISGSEKLSQDLAPKYRVRFLDFVHAIMSTLAFSIIAIFNTNVESCFFHAPSKGTRNILAALPVGINFLCGILFVSFPTQRHGIGFPVTEE